eukprot:gene8195-biopygen19618
MHMVCEWVFAVQHFKDPREVPGARLVGAQGGGQFPGNCPEGTRIFCPSPGGGGCTGMWSAVDGGGMWNSETPDPGYRPQCSCNGDCYVPSRRWPCGSGSICQR